MDRCARALTGAALASAVLLAPALAACTHQTRVLPDRTVTVTVTPTPSPSSSSSSSPSTGGTSGTSGAAGGSAGAGAASSADVAQTRLPGTCADVLPQLSVENGLDVTITGTTAFVVGVAEPDIGLVTRLDCRYGLTRAAPDDPQVEISVGLYSSDARASARLAPTVSDFEAHGASAAGVTVGTGPGAVPAQVLTGGSGAGYGPTVVLATGRRTVAVTLAGAVARSVASRQTAALSALAAAVVQRTST